MSKNKTSNGNTDDPSQIAFAEKQPDSPPAQTNMGRRSFIKKLGLAATVMPVGGALLTTSLPALADNGNSKLTDGDAAILRFLAAAEILETDLWQQYTELALGNPRSRWPCRFSTATCRPT